jgi:hypothetical protein
MGGINRYDTEAIKYVNHVTNNLYDLVDSLYEDLMDRENESAKKTAQHICQLMGELNKSLTDET